MSTVTATSRTVFDAIVGCLNAAAVFNKDDVVQPAAILWPDEKREWERLVPRLRMMLPQFLVFGPYDKANGTGPAIWLRCVLSGKVPDTCLPPDCVPIIYLPGVSRATLRATEECPVELRPIAELQYRGVFWSQVSSKDWTITAFLQTNHGGLQLKIAKDTGTATSIRRSIEKLADVPVEELRKKAASGELNSTYFDLLISDDPIDDLLTWLSDPKGTRDRSEATRWETLCSRCIADYGFDPVRDGEVVAAEKLGLQEKLAWKTVWKRFAASPARYPGLLELLRRAKPKAKAGELAFFCESWPQDNESGEADLRHALSELASLSITQARERIQEMEKGHAIRRQWVWAKLNRSPLAQAMQSLATMAETTRSPLGGATAADMIRIYTESGWKVDAAVLDALAAVSTQENRKAVGTAKAEQRKLLTGLLEADLRSIFDAILPQQDRGDPHSIRFAVDNWQVWQEPEHDLGGAVIINGWREGCIRYSCTIRLRNELGVDEEIHRLRMEFRQGGKVLLADTYAFDDRGVVLPPKKWVSLNVSYGLHDDGVFPASDSVWFVAETVGDNSKVEWNIAAINDRSISLAEEVGE